MLRRAADELALKYAIDDNSRDWVAVMEHREESRLRGVDDASRPDDVDEEHGEDGT